MKFELVITRVLADGFVNEVIDVFGWNEANRRFEAVRDGAPEDVFAAEVVGAGPPLPEWLMWRNPRYFADNAEECPACGNSLQGEPIPEADQQSFAATHFSRKIGLYDWGRDCTTSYRCPDCEAEWMRDPNEVARIQIPQPLDGDDVGTGPR